MQRKRISIRIEHTEIALYITEAYTPDPTTRGAVLGEPLPPRRCPACGSAWLPNLHDELGGLRLTAAQLKLAASKGKLHLFCSPNNEVWICELSLQEASSLPDFRSEIRER